MIARTPSESITPTAEKSTLTKKDLARAISESLGTTRLQAMEIIDKILHSITETLVEDGRVELRNFGVFDVRRRRPRIARNPRTGEKVAVPASCTVAFKPGARFRGLNRTPSRPETPAVRSTLPGPVAHRSWGGSSRSRRIQCRPNINCDCVLSLGTRSRLRLT